MSTQAGIPTAGSATVRSYSSSDEQDWLRCRVLAFLDTAYFDDVLTQKPRYDGLAIELVAESAGTVVALIDVAVEGDKATIEHVAVHPDLARSGIGSLLLAEVLRRMPSEVATLDAWTRDDEAANNWYLRSGFCENFRYLHVYASGDHEPSSAVVQARPGLTPVAGFFHADFSSEDVMRSMFSRVHICRQYLLALSHT